MNSLLNLEGVLNRLIELYEKLVELTEKERKYLINIDGEGLEKLTKQKQLIADELESKKNQLKEILSLYDAENISEFLFIVSENRKVDHLRMLNGKLRKTIDEFVLKSNVNKMIATENLQFFNGLLNLYGSLFSKENYDKNAQTPINGQIMSVRV